MAYHLDKRAATIMGGTRTLEPDRLLSTAELAEVLGCSVAWLELRRMNGGGPPYIRVSHRRVRYKVSDLEQWLRSRTFTNTAEAKAGKTAEGVKAGALKQAARRRVSHER
jgi:predicted DNA-binding transcriptional regulator AlpA